jgi:hypothetical protein
MSHRDRPTGQGLGGGGQRTAEQGPGGAHPAAGPPGTQAQPAPQPGSGRALLDPLLGPGRPPGVDRGQFLEPVAFQPVQQPPQHQHPLGQDPIREPCQLLAGQCIHRGRQHRQPIGRPHRTDPGRPAGRMCVRVHGGQPIRPHPNAKHQSRIWRQLFWSAGLDHSRLRARAPATVPGCVHGARGSRPPCQASTWGPSSPTILPGECMGTRPLTPVPGDCMGPDPRPPCQASAWGPKPDPPCQATT